MKKIALLMPVHNKLDFTKRTVEGLDRLIKESALKDTSVDIVITDDGSTDGTGEWLEENFPDVKVLRGDGNLWWSGGINVAARYALEELNSDYLLLWNNDIIIDRDYFKETEKLLQEKPSDTIIGSKIYYLHKPGTIWAFGAEFNPRSGKRDMIAYNTEDGPEYQEPREVDWLPGMGTLIPVGVIGKIGYWDEKNFPQYHGDSDYIYRAKRAGYKIMVYPQLKLWNDKSSSGLVHGGKFMKLIRMLSDTRSNLNVKKNIMFYRKHSSSFTAYWPLLVSYFYLFGGFFKWKILSLFGKKKRED